MGSARYQARRVVQIAAVQGRLGRLIQHRSPASLSWDVTFQTAASSDF